MDFNYVCSIHTVSTKQDLLVFIFQILLLTKNNVAEFFQEVLEATTTITMHGITVLFLCLERSERMAKLTDRQKKRIIAEYAEGKGQVSYASLGKKYGVDKSTIAKVIKNNPEFQQKATEIKNENTKSMLDYLVGKRDKAQNILDMLLDLTPVDIKKASLRDRMGAVKIIAETFGVTKPDEPTGAEDNVIQVEIVNNAKKD